jgi:hypothetical protein
VVINHAYVLTKSVFELRIHNVIESIRHDRNDHVHEDNHHQEGTRNEGDPKETYRNRC